MTTYFLDPNGHANALWRHYSYSGIAEYLRQPDEPDLSTKVSPRYAAADDDRGEEQIYNLSTFTLLYSETVTSVKVWMWGRFGGYTSSCTANINVAGCNAQSMNLDFSNEWMSNTWTTANFGPHGITQAVLDALQMSFIPQFPTYGSEILFHAGYIEITTEPVSTTLYLDPNGNNNVLWTGPLYTQIDENVREPDDPDVNFISANGGDDNENQAYNMNGTLPYGWRVTRVDYWANGNLGTLGPVDTPWGDINWAGCDEKSLGFTTGVQDWYTVAWTGLAVTSQATVAGTIIYINSKNIDDLFKGPAIICWKIYLKLTIEQYINDPGTGPANWAKWNGIAIGDLAKWNGIEIGDIAKYNGID